MSLQFFLGLARERSLHKCSVKFFIKLHPCWKFGLAASMLPWNLSSWYLMPRLSLTRKWLVVNVIRASTNSDPSEHILNCDSEFSLADGIDYWVAQWADSENTRCNLYGLGRNLNDLKETAKKTLDQDWKKAQQKRSNNNDDIYSCLPLRSLSCRPLLLHFRILKASNLDYCSGSVMFRRLVDRPV